MEEERYQKPYYLSPHQNLAKDVVFGLGAGVVGMTASAPLDRVKLLLQTSFVSDKVYPPYRGIIDTFKRTIGEQGFLSLWRGNFTNILRYSSLVVLHANLYNYVQRVIIRKDHQEHGFYSRRYFMAGLVSAVPAVILTYPLDVLYTKIATDAGARENRRFKGLRHAFTKVRTYDGFWGFYLNSNFSFFTILLHRLLWLGSYDTVKHVMLPDPLNAPLWQNYLVAHTVVTTSAFLIYPFDTVRRRLMMRFAGRRDIIYYDYKDAFKRIFWQEGIRGFYKGGLANVFRGFSAASALLLWDFTRKYYHLDDPVDDLVVRRINS